MPQPVLTKDQRDVLRRVAAISVKLLAERPPHFTKPAWRTWDEAQQAQVAAVLAALQAALAAVDSSLTFEVTVHDIWAGQRTVIKPGGGAP